MYEDVLKGKWKKIKGGIKFIDRYNTCMTCGMPIKNGLCSGCGNPTEKCTCKGKSK